MRRKFTINALLKDLDTTASIEIVYNGKLVASGVVSTDSLSEGDKDPTSFSFFDDLKSTNSITISNLNTSTGPIKIQGLIIERATVATWQTAQIDGATVNNTENDLYISQNLAPGSIVTLNLDGLVTASFTTTFTAAPIPGMPNPYLGQTA
jgi:hypothetical protein